MNYTLIVLLAYAVVMFGATVLMTKKEGNVERFCVGNRDTGWGISALSIAATWIWAPAGRWELCGKGRQYLYQQSGRDEIQPALRLDP